MRMNRDTSLPFFVYGTLRSGGGNAQRLPATDERYDAEMTNATLHYVSGSYGGFPVLCDSDDPTDVVIGEVVYLDVEHPAVQSTVEMEIGAGYDLRPRLAYITKYGRTIGALTFVYPPERHKGARIMTGDWKDQDDATSGQ